MSAEIINGINSYFTFRLGTELFAVNVGSVTKILGYTEITKVPNSPSYFKGIINVFGDVLPVFDGRLKFGFAALNPTRETCIVIMVFKVEEQIVSAGIIVDSVEKVLTFEPENIKPAPTIGKGFNYEFINGITTYNNEFVIILNIERIFSEEEISIISNVE